MSNQTIKIYYDARKNFYVEKSSGKADLLPEDFLDFRIIHKQALAEAYPEMRERIMNAIPGESFVDDVIQPKIKEYNEAAQKSKVTRWFKVTDGALRQISENSIVFELIFASDYDGEEDAEEILKFIAEIKEQNFKEEYLVFACPECGKKQIEKISKNRVKCENGCGGYAIDDEKLIVKQKFSSRDGEANKAGAIYSLLEWTKETENPREEAEEYEKTNSPFYYDGTVYRVNFTDEKSLHKKLYFDFAVDEVFIEKNSRVTFTEDYKKYLKSLKDYGVDSVLYSSLKGEENRINSQEYALLPKEKAFYYYLKKYCLKDEPALSCKVCGVAAAYESPKEFLNDLLFADERRKRQLVSVYENVSSLDLDNPFFAGADGTLTGLSYVIFKSTGKFVYVTQDKFIDFGENFIDELSLFDDKIADRNAFIEQIKSTYPDFWNEIKGTFDDYADFYYDSKDGSYYDRLCFYRYAIEGKRDLVYKKLRVPDSVDGFNYIKTIICDAYLNKDERSLKTFEVLKELLQNEFMWNNPDRFVKIKCAVTIRAINGTESEKLTLESLQELLKKEVQAEPSIDLYLACVNIDGVNVKNLKFWYKGRLLTLAEHIFRIVKDGKPRTIEASARSFLEDNDVKKITGIIFKYISDGGFEKFESEHNKRFLALAEQTEKLGKDLEETRKSYAEAEMRGRRNF